VGAADRATRRPDGAVGADGHQYAKTTPLPFLAGHNDELTEAGKPILRHQNADLYFREHVDRIGVGAYGHRPMPISAAEIADPRSSESMPSELAFTPADFEESWAAAVDLLPVLGDAKVEEGINGLFSFTPDGMPLLGEHPDLDGFWVPEAVWITHSAGVARSMAEWMVDGQPMLDLHSCDLARFEQVQLAPDYVRARSCQRFVEVYDIVHPLQPMDDPRPLLHQRSTNVRPNSGRTSSKRVAGSGRTGTSATRTCPRSSKSRRATTGRRGSGRRSAAQRHSWPGSGWRCST
jgi:hypothetical protein